MQIMPLMFLMFALSCSVGKKSPATKKISTSEGTLTATNWFQTSGEAKALYYQAYHLAKISFDHALKKKTAKPKAVVVDIDETILDNSPYQAKLIKEDAAYPSFWAEWIEKNSAEALPGAVDFLNYVDKNKVTVFYISNRKQKDQSLTFDLLKKVGFPVKETSQLLFQTDTSNKTSRREKVKENYEIILLVGDNLNDFDGIFEKKSIEERSGIVDQMKHDFGAKFIVLPNPLYGDWDSAIFNYNYQMSDQDKHHHRIKALKSF